jgi:hypothetical protein
MNEGSLVEYHSVPVDDRAILGHDGIKKQDYPWQLGFPIALFALVVGYLFAILSAEDKEGVGWDENFFSSLFYNFFLIFSFFDSALTTLWAVDWDTRKRLVFLVGMVFSAIPGIPAFAMADASNDGGPLGCLGLGRVDDALFQEWVHRVLFLVYMIGIRGFGLLNLITTVCPNVCTVLSCNNFDEDTKQNLVAYAKKHQWDNLFKDLNQVVDEKRLKIISGISWLIALIAGGVSYLPWFILAIEGFSELEHYMGGEGGVIAFSAVSALVNAILYGITFSQMCLYTVARGVTWNQARHEFFSKEASRGSFVLACVTLIAVGVNLFVGNGTGDGMINSISNATTDYNRFDDLSDLAGSEGYATIFGAEAGALNSFGLALFMSKSLQKWPTCADFLKYLTTCFPFNCCKDGPSPSGFADGGGGGERSEEGCWEEAKAPFLPCNNGIVSGDNVSVNNARGGDDRSDCDLQPTCLAAAVVVVESGVLPATVFCG